MIYKIQTNSLNDKMIIRIEDNAFIPMDEANTDYQAYLKWVAEGNEAEEWEVA
jgi:hypothetical protein